jgi:AcrR family transcriptional regulator
LSSRIRRGDERLPPTATTTRPLRADAQRNRDAIIAAARRIVAEQGVEAQIQDVAREAGVGIGTVYRHFPTKDALMAELIGQCARENAVIGREVLADTDDKDVFSTLVLRACHSMAADAAKRRVWAVASDEAVALAEDAKTEMASMCGEVIARAHAAGGLRKDFTHEDMPGLMCGLAAAIDAQPPGGWERLVQFALDGLRARS